MFVAYTIFKVFFLKYFKNQTKVKSRVINIIVAILIIYTFVIVYQTAKENFGERALSYLIFQFINQIPNMASLALASQNMGKENNLYSAGENTITNIKAPVLHIWGTHDKTVPEYMILDNIKALEENSTYVKFDQCGHSPLVDKPEELTSTVLQFLAR